MYRLAYTVVTDFQTCAMYTKMMCNEKKRVNDHLNGVVGNKH